MPDLINTQKMQTYTVEQFQERWDEMIERVESGEHISITNGKNTCVMVPADDELIRIYTEENNEAP
jgi:predicted nuclease with TOPRIM domain